MKTLSIVLLCFLTTACWNTKQELVASKCRLGVPVKQADCNAAGVKILKGGQLAGLPVSEMKTGKSTQEIMIADTESHLQFLEWIDNQKQLEDWIRTW